MRAVTRLSLAALALVAASAAPASAASDKPRLIVLTDIGNEPDDAMSMVRLLTYADVLDIEGLFATTSVHLPDQVGPHLIRERIEAYRKVLPNLRVHDPAYPDADALLARVGSGLPVLGMAGVGKGKDSEASQQIIAAVDRPDSRPVWVSVWGGAQPLAQALWKVRATRGAAELARFVDKLRVYSISDQDDAGPWARANFPKLFWIASVHGPQQYPLAAWTGISAAVPGADPAPVSRKWIDENVRSKGPLGEVYPRVIFIMEGDTPSFLYLIPNGLGSSEHPDWGSWGGRYGRLAPDVGWWSDVEDGAAGVDGKPVRSNKATVWRWREAFQNDFAARMKWSVTPVYKDANHPPVPVLNGKPGLAPVELRACAGDVVALSAAGSSDPDGQALRLRWWLYNEAGGSGAPQATLASSEGTTTTLTVPVWPQARVSARPAYSFHVILEARDDGTPGLTRYRRAVVTVPLAGGKNDSGQVCAPVPVMPMPRLKASTVEPYVATLGRFSTTDSTIGELAADPKARAIVERTLPGMLDRIMAAEQAAGMTLRGIGEFVPGVTTEKLDAIDASLAKLR